MRVIRQRSIKNSFKNMDWKAHQKMFLLLVIIGVILLIYYCANDSILTSYNIENRKNMTVIMEEYLPGRSDRYHSLQLEVDRSHPLRDDVVRDAQEAMPNLPITFWEQNKEKKLYYKNNSCSRFPNVYNLRINNMYWQILDTKEATFYLFGAYYDARDRCSMCPAIRILGTIDHAMLQMKTFCQIWFADIEEPAIVESLEYFYYMQYDGNVKHLFSHPVLITCPIPQSFRNRVPIFVSLVERMCDGATNSLRVIFNKPNTPAAGEKGFAVCVKTLNFPHEDISLLLIEWIELMQLLGADKIIFYTLFLHENVTKILKHYEQKGVVEMVPTTLIGNGVHMHDFLYLQLEGRDWKQKWTDELVQLNDCFYKNMYKYRYITELDTDEIIIPHDEYNWTNLMNRVLRKTNFESKIASYRTRMVLFPDCENQTERNSLYMLQHVYCERNRSMIKGTTKTFFDTKLVLALNNHYVRACLIANCKDYYIQREDAELFHYRKEQYTEVKPWSCEKLIQRNQVDTTIWKYKEQLLNSSLTTLYKLGFYS